MTNDAAAKPKPAPNINNPADGADPYRLAPPVMRAPAITAILALIFSGSFVT